jgi:hypothetical protein
MRVKAVCVLDERAKAAVKVMNAIVASIAERAEGRRARAD